jgi:hypothetical protein
MKKFLYLIVLLISLQFCNENDQIKQNCPEIDKYKLVHTDTLMKEVLEYDSLKINGNLSLKLSEKEVFKQFGKEFKRIQNYRNNEQILDYGFIKFVLHDGFYYCTYIELYDTDLSLHHPKIILNKRTLIGEVQELYPLSVKLSESGGSTFWGVLFINTSNRFDFRKWLLYFGNGRLTKLILIAPDDRDFR